MPTSREQFVQRMASSLHQAGLARVPSLVFAALLIDDDGRMTSAELAEALHVSPASVSGAVRYLEQISMLRRERERGSRRDVYVVEDQTWHTALMRRDQVYAPMIAALSEGLQAVPDTTPAHRRMVVTRAFFAFVNEEMQGLADRWERRRRELFEGASE
ncbi:MAG TPA: MarR family transcriptional regulator [Marmoricola sp.]|nr:MarR family transcriptional regulator [Marmoricola sp.]